jgi:cytochrome c-type biogenesis protein CcmH/NrfF
MRGLTRTGWIGLVALTAVLLLGAGDDSARFNSLGHRLMCMCGCNQVLLECNHVGCQYSDRMRGELVAAMDRGDNDSLVLQDFVQKYGTTVLLAPSTTGFGSVAWITPFAALVLGIGAIYFVVRAWKKRPPPPLADGITPVPGPAMDQYREQARKDTQL